MKNKTENEKDEMLKEYDFSKGVRGKYAEKYAKGNNIVIIEADLFKEFPDSGAVNNALRKFLNLKKLVSK
jgi:urate oxidase